MKNTDDKKLEALLASIELPDSAYDKAVSRYEDLGTWLNRDDSTIKKFHPRVSAQGSFALGTAISPLNPKEEYDLDLTSKLQEGVDPGTHSQFQLKEMIRLELELYRIARNIQEELDEKRRCWRLQYRDSPGFHLDIVPGVPANPVRREVLIAEMRAQGVPQRLLPELAAEALWITDNTHPAYRLVSPDSWLSSNPSGYVAWFRSRLTGPELTAEALAKVDSVPVYRRKTTLQQVIQLLKRHRDVMFATLQDSRPISAIITTIAARSSRPGEALTETIRTVLRALDEFRLSNSNVVPNPVNPEENFADKWTMPAFAHLHLKQNFHLWVEQANAYFANILATASGVQFVTEAGRGLRINPPSEKVAAAFSVTKIESPPAVHTPPRIHVQEPPRPWRIG